MQDRHYVFLYKLLSILCVLGLLFTSTSTICRATIRQRTARTALVGPKTTYLALGDSLAFGFQPNLNWNAGYASDFFQDLQSHGVKNYVNLACVGETTVTILTGDCPFSLLRKYPYTGSQLTAALDYLSQHAGYVSPVTLDIGANDMVQDINSTNCTISPHWSADLARMDSNLATIILPQLVAALTLNGRLTGDLFLINYYDPFQNICPNSIPYIQELNQHLANDAAGLAMLIDIFTPFGGTNSPDPQTCDLTWMCGTAQDIHPQDRGYNMITTILEQNTGY